MYTYTHVYRRISDLSNMRSFVFVSIISLFQGRKIGVLLLVAFDKFFFYSAFITYHSVVGRSGEVGMVIEESIVLIGKSTFK